eukprot:199956_1
MSAESNITTNPHDIPNKTQYLVLGFTKNLNNNIPIDIMYIIMIFIYDVYAEYDHNQCSKVLDFPLYKTVQKIKENWDYSTCLVGKEITNKMIDKYEIHFKIKSSQHSGFAFGYVEKEKEDLGVFMCVDFEDGLCAGQNYHISSGVYVWNNATAFQFGNQSPNYNALPVDSAFPVKNGDIFALLFDFNNNYLQISHNGYTVAKKISLYNKIVIPAVSIYKKK